MERRDKVDAVQRMQDFIEEHITEPITLFKLADASGCSPWHSARLFKELTGKTPFESMRKPCTSVYAQGVEVPANFK